MLRLLIMILGLFPGVAQAAASEPERPEIVWLNLHLPPAFIASGPMQGEGYVDKSHAYFASRLTGYRHSMLNVSVLRAESLLTRRDGTCTLGLLANRSRVAQLPFSDWAIPIVPNRMFVWGQDRARFMPYLDAEGRIDLAAMKEAEGFVVGYSLGRFYHEPISDYLTDRRSRPGAETETIMIESERIAFLLANRRIDVAFGYPEEVGYQMRHGGMGYLDPGAFASFAVKGVAKDVEGGVACSNTELGRQVVRDVDLLLREPGVREKLSGYYAEWVDADTRRDLDKALKERPVKAATTP